MSLTGQGLEQIEDIHEECYIIYRAQSPSGKSYIGITGKGLDKRRKQHIKTANSKLSKNLKFHRAILKYGSDSISWEILEKVNSFEKAKDREMFYIAQFDSLYNGYNMTAGGGGAKSFKHSEEAKAKISIKSKNQVTSDEKRRKISELQKGRVVSEKNRKIVSESIKRTHKLFPEKYEAVYKRTRRPVVQLDKNYEIIAIYDSALAAAKSLNVNPVSISQSCNFKTFKNCGYIWVFKEGLEDNIARKKEQFENIVGKNGKTTPKYGRRVAQYNENNEIIAVFDSVKKAALENKISASYATRIIKKTGGKRSHIKLGFI